MQLVINTLDRDKVSFELKDGRKVVASYEADFPQNQKSDVLKHLEKFLSAHTSLPRRGEGPRERSRPAKSAKSYKVSGISLVTGEGSKTGLRVGSAIAQALSLAWGMPVKKTKQKSTTLPQ